MAKQERVQAIQVHPLEGEGGGRLGINHIQVTKYNFSAQDAFDLRNN